MSKFISTAIIASSMAVCSFSVPAASDISDKDKETMRKESLSNPNEPENTNKKEGHKYDTKAGAPSEKERETMRKETVGKETTRKETLGEPEKGVKGTDQQEIMNKKPYKQ
jgi:hypothetical protein